MAYASEFLEIFENLGKLSTQLNLPLDDNCIEFVTDVDIHHFTGTFTNIDRYVFDFKNKKLIVYIS